MGWHGMSDMSGKHEQNEWQEAQPSAFNEASVLLLLYNLGSKHILMA